MNTTLQDIADLAGVSKSTVSRAINGDPRISDETRDRVLEIVAREGYRPNVDAQRLASGKTNVIALGLPGWASDTAVDPFFSELLVGVTTTADARDHLVMLAFVGGGYRNTIAQIAKRGLVAGVVFASGFVDEAFLEPFLSNDTPVVSIGRVRDDSVSYVDIDNRGNARLATNHLLRQGRQRVATITGLTSTPNGIDRLEGYTDAIEAAGFPVEDKLIYVGDFSEASGRAGARNLLPHQPDAIFVANDRMAAGARSEIQAAGLRVPEDIALVGFDDIPLAAELEPPLTTVRQYPRKLGETAATLLLDKIEHGLEETQRIILPTELIVRSSCGSHVTPETAQIARTERGQSN